METRLFVYQIWYVLEVSLKLNMEKLHRNMQQQRLLIIEKDLILQ